MWNFRITNLKFSTRKKICHSNLIPDRFALSKDMRHKLSHGFFFILCTARIFCLSHSISFPSINLQCIGVYFSSTTCTFFSFDGVRGQIFTMQNIYVGALWVNSCSCCVHFTPIHRNTLFYEHNDIWFHCMCSWEIRERKNLWKKWWKKSVKKNMFKKNRSRKKFRNGKINSRTVLCTHHFLLLTIKMVIGIDKMAGIITAKSSV